MEVRAYQPLKKLARLWFIGEGAIFLLLFLQTVIGTYVLTRHILWGWLWWVAISIPFFLLMMSYTDFGKWRRHEYFSKAHYKQVMLLSRVYLVLAFLVLFLFMPIARMSDVEVIVPIQLSLLGLLPFAAILTFLMATLLFQKATASIPDSEKKKIMFLGVNPKNATHLRIDEEFREIHQALKMAKQREQFILVSDWAVTAATLQQNLLDEDPYIIHFSGHGTAGEQIPMNQGRDLKWQEDAKEGLALEDAHGNIHLVSSETLAQLFKEEKHTECVVLNACYSRVQAEAIVAHIPYVIGMKQAIQDPSAIAFSVGFYRGLGAGKSIEEAFEAGTMAMKLGGVPGDRIPELLTK